MKLLFGFVVYLQGERFDKHIDFVFSNGMRMAGRMQWMLKQRRDIFTIG